MPDITNAEAVRFVNEVVRPLARQMRALKAAAKAANDTWFAGMNAVITGGATDKLQDGRDAEGVSRLTGSDINQFMTALFGATNDTNMNPQVIGKPCVGPLETR